MTTRKSKSVLVLLMIVMLLCFNVQAQQISARPSEDARVARLVGGGHTRLRSPVAPQTARQPVAIEVCGTLVGADGKPMIRATVVVSRPFLPGGGFIKEEERVLGKQEIANSATFCVVASGSGLLQMQAFGVNHQPADALFWAEPGSKHRVSIKLATPRLLADLSAARVVCYQSLPSFRRLDEAALERQADGRYRAVIKGQDFPALCGFYGVTRAPCVEVEPRGPDCIQGTQSDGYELQRGFGIGRYSAVVMPVNGQGYVFLDPSALPRSDEPGQVTFPAAAGTSRRLTAIWQAMLARDLQDRSGTSPAPSRTKIVAALAAARAERNAVVRQALWANYLSLATADMRRSASGRTDADRAGVAAALRALTAASPFWPLVRTHLFDAVQAAKLPLTPEGYAGDVVRNLRTPSERPIAIEAFSRVAHRQKDTVALNAWLSWLLRDYEGHNLARVARERYGLNDKVQVGKPFPEFAVRSLDDPGVTLTAKTIGARFLLVDFWATWCSPCIAEIPSLQKAYDRFSGQGFRILSYSLDDDADLVRQFRHDRFPMPWLHGIFRQGSDGLSENFGLFGIPAPVLLDAEGRVVAMRGDLLGGKLEALLETLIR